MGTALAFHSDFSRSNSRSTFFFSDVNFVEGERREVVPIFLVNVELVSMKISIDILGSPAYYVTVECGTHEHRTKVSSG